MNENGHSAFLPVLIALITLSIWFGFQTYQLVQERTNMAKASANQETTYKTAQKMRAQMDALAAGTSKLAQQNNANAQQIVSALAQRGITINAPEAAKPAVK